MGGKIGPKDERFNMVPVILLTSAVTLEERTAIILQNFTQEENGSRTLSVVDYMNTLSTGELAKKAPTVIEASYGQFGTMYSKSR